MYYIITNWRPRLENQLFVSALCLISFGIGYICPFIAQDWISIIIKQFKHWLAALFVELFAFVLIERVINADWSERISPLLFFNWICFNIPKQHEFTFL